MITIAAAIKDGGPEQFARESSRGSADHRSWEGLRQERPVNYGGGFSVEVSHLLWESRCP